MGQFESLKIPLSHLSVLVVDRFPTVNYRNPQLNWVAYVTISTNKSGISNGSSLLYTLCLCRGSWVHVDSGAVRKNLQGIWHVKPLNGCSYSFLSCCCWHTASDLYNFQRTESTELATIIGSRITGPSMATSGCGLPAAKPQYDIHHDHQHDGIAEGIGRGYLVQFHPGKGLDGARSLRQDVFEFYDGL